MASKATERESEIKAIQMNLSRLEQLGVQRATLMSLVETDIQAIDKGRKAERENLQGHIKAIDDVTLATAAANAIAPRLANADDTTRKRLQRRRTWLRSALKTSYPLYDFAVEPGKNSRGIMAEHVGDEDVRKAIQNMETIASAFALLGAKVPKTVTVDNLAAKIKEERQGKLSTTVESADFGPIADDVAPLDLSTVAGRIQGLTLPEAEALPADKDQQQVVGSSV